MNTKGGFAVRSISALVVLFGVALLCSIWGGLYFKVQNERQLEIAGAFKETGNYTVTFEENLVRTFRGLDQVAVFLKYQAEKEGRSLDIPRLVQEGRFAGQPYVLLSVVDETGDLIASSQTPFVFSNLKDREHFLVHRDADRGLFISQRCCRRGSLEGSA